MIAKEILMAYVDGELSPDEARAVEAEIAIDPDLKAYVDQQHVLARRLHDSLDIVLRTPLPDALVASINASAPKTSRFSAPWRRIAWVGIPTAVALACGVLVGLSFRDGPDVTSANGALIAHGQLAEALTQELASDDRAEVGITFRDKNGRYCRTFVTRQTSSLAGVACRSDGAWQIAAVGSVGRELVGAYQPAASAMPEFVRHAVSGLIGGQPLDAAQERKARAEGWR
jgi:hypothetical protein